MLKTSQMIILACVAAAHRQAGSRKKARDASDSLPGLAVQCVAALLGLCHSAADLACLLQHLPAPADCEGAGQP